MQQHHVLPVLQIVLLTGCAEQPDSACCPSKVLKHSECGAMALLNAGANPLTQQGQCMKWPVDTAGLPLVDHASCYYSVGKSSSCAGKKHMLGKVTGRHRLTVLLANCDWFKLHLGFGYALRVLLTTMNLTSYFHSRNFFKVLSTSSMSAYAVVLQFHDSLKEVALAAQLAAVRQQPSSVSDFTPATTALSMPSQISCSPMPTAPVSTLPRQVLPAQRASAVQMLLPKINTISCSDSTCSSISSTSSSRPFASSGGFTGAFTALKRSIVGFPAESLHHPCSQLPVVTTLLSL